ncbi:MAG: hypothetical protein HUK15_07275 [Bacteroidales bacterium]|nr:hypothetical protein [Bacteroidales bacterium]
MAFIFTSCEKEEETNNNDANNVKACNYVLMQKGYVDENGYVCDLYVDENNPDNMYFQLTSQSRANTKIEFNGKWVNEEIRDVIVNSYCDTTREGPYDCCELVIDGKKRIYVSKDAVAIVIPAKR